MPRIIALITVYQPTIQNIVNIQNIADQVDMAYVVDNSTENNVEKINKNIYYHHMGYNSGIAKAFNYYLKNSENEFHVDDYIIFFDQDSRISKNHIKKLVRRYQFIKTKYPNIGCIGPIYYNTSNKTYEIPHIKKRIDKYSYEVTDLITSSMLCEYGNLKSIGFWNEDLFLDGADWDLCWRLKKKGMICCLTNYVHFEHSVGIGEKRILGISMRKSNLIRSYYRTRDTLYLLNRKYTPKRIRLYLLIDVTIKNILRIIFLEERKERYKLMLKGYNDFKLGISGEIS